MSMNYNYNPTYANPYQRTYNTPSYMQPQYQMQPQQMVQQAQPQQPIEVPIQATIYATLKEAEGQIMYPNTKILFVDKEKGMSYLKSANNDGVSSIRYFKQVEVNADGTPIKEVEVQEKINISDFLKKDDMKEYVTVDMYNNLLSRIEQLQKQLSTPKATPTKQV